MKRVSSRTTGIQGARDANLASRWDWELNLSPRILKRMEDRSFTEVDLRRMLERATGFREDFVDQRFVIETRFQAQRWEVIVEPDPVERVLIVVTAYCRDRP